MLQVPVFGGTFFFTCFFVLFCFVLFFCLKVVVLFWRQLRVVFRGGVPPFEEETPSKVQWPPSET